MDGERRNSVSKLAEMAGSGVGLLQLWDCDGAALSTQSGRRRDGSMGTSRQPEATVATLVIKWTDRCEPVLLLVSEMGVEMQRIATTDFAGG
jgi:hypothetical protein